MPPNHPLTGREDFYTPITPNRTDRAFAQDDQRRTLQGQLPQSQIDLTEDRDRGLDNGNSRSYYRVVS